jgi:hypothetical protein
MTIRSGALILWEFIKHLQPGKIIGTMLLATLFALSLPGVQAQADTVETHLGPIAGGVELGKDGPWETSLANGWVMFKNTADADSIVIYHNSFDRLNAGSRTIKVNLALRADPNAFAGLLFDYVPSKTYFAIAIAGDGSVSMYGNQGDGFAKMGTSDKVRGRLDGSDVLEVRQEPGAAEFILNGELVFKMNKDAGFAENAGIIMGGTGQFAFDGFDVQTVGNTTGGGGGSGSDDPFPPPGGGGGGTAENEPFPPPGGGGGGGGSGGGSGPAPGPGQTPGPQPSAQDIYVSKVIAGTTLGVFFHEFGHAVIGELKLPATGPEEDVADGFAAFVLGSVFEDPENWDNAQEEDILQGIAEYSSLLWYYNGLKMEKEGKQEGWQGEHAPSLRRFRNSFCIIYGSDPARFGPLADKVQINERTRARCLQEYEKRYRAWENILKPVSRNLGPDIPGDHPADAPGGKIILTFQEPKGEIGRVVTTLVRDTDVMKDVAQLLEKAFVWPRDVQVEFRDCEQINAWYDPQIGKVTMCYSIVEHFSKIVFAAETGGGGGGGTGGGGGGGTEPRREPQPDPRRQPTPRQQEPTAADYMAYFVGTWAATISSPEGSFNAQVTYNKDLTYQLILQLPMGQTEVRGTWSAQPAGTNKARIEAVPSDWSPRQYCNAYGYCQPNPQYPSQVVVHLIDKNRVNAEGNVWQRVQ